MASAADSIEDRVIATVAAQMRVAESAITLETSFIDDLGVGSLDTAELVMAFEDEFELAIPSDEAQRLETVGEAIDYIAAHV